MGNALDVKLPEQSPDNIRPLGDIIYHNLVKNDWLYADLARKAGLSKATIHRLVTNSDNRGSTYHTTIEVVHALAIAFQLDDAEFWELFLAAFPQFPILMESRRKKLSMEDANQALIDQGYLPITKTFG